MCEVAELLPAYARWYLCLVIPSIKRAKVIRELPELEVKRQALGYLGIVVLGSSRGLLPRGLIGLSTMQATSRGPNEEKQP